MPTEMDNINMYDLLENLKLPLKFKCDSTTADVSVSATTATTETTTTSGTTSIGGYVSPSRPVIYTTTTTSPITWSTTFTNPIAELKEKIKEYTEKTDEHVDKLEEDIQFLNDRREQNEQNYNDLVDVVAALERRIISLEKENVDRKNYAQYLEDRINILEEGLNKLEDKYD